MSEWISAKDQLPEPYENVIVPGGLAYYDAFESRWICMTGQDSLYPFEYAITHWMPLPEPPEEA